MEILKVENLSKIYGKGETSVKAIDNISFSVEEGEFVAIIGPSYLRAYQRRPRERGGSGCRTGGGRGPRRQPEKHRPKGRKAA